jgi:hypothetical protein
VSVLIVLTGWWSAGGASEYVLNPLVGGATGTVWNTLVGWMFIPFGAYSALKVSTCFCHLALKRYTKYFYLASETYVVMVKQDGDVQNKGCVRACLWVGQKISAQDTYLGSLF